MDKRLKTVLIYILIVVASIIPMFPMFNNGFIDGHDNAFHYAQIQDMYNAWMRGQFNNYLNSEASHYFGMGVKLFYAPLSHLTTVIVGFIITPLGLGLTTAMKIVIYLSVLLSGIFAYHFFKKLSKNRELPAIIGALFFMLFPYRFTDVYVRNAFAETIAMLFIPLVFNGIYSILKLDKPRVGPFATVIVGASGIIMTHNITAFYAFFFVFFYLLFYIKDVIKLFKTKWFWIYTGISVVIILSLISPLVIPMLQHKALGIYRIFDGTAMGTNYARIDSEVKRSTAFLMCSTYGDALECIFTYMFILIAFVLLFQIKRYIKTKKVYYFFIALLGISVGIFALIYGLEKEPHRILIITVIFGTILLLIPFNNEKNEEEKIDFNGIALYAFLSIISIMLIYLTFLWKILNALHLDIFFSIQFPWRLWIFFAFFISAFAVYIFDIALTRFGKYLEVKALVVVLGTLIIMVIRPINTYSYSGSGPTTIDNTYLASINAAGWNREYFPIEFIPLSRIEENKKSSFFYECRSFVEKEGNENSYLSKIGIIEGQASYKNYSLDNDVIEFDLEVTGNETVLIELPRIYYLGYSITTTDKDGIVINETPIYSEGLLAYKTTNSGHVRIQYKGTALMGFSRVAFGLGMTALVGIPITLEILKKKKKVEKSSEETEENCNK